MAEVERRRRRLRHPATDADGHNPERVADLNGPEPRAAYDPRPAGPPSQRRVPSAEDREGERGLRALVGSGSSQVSLGAALRARDAARPTETDLAEAERRVVLVRRNWTPPRRDTPRSGSDPTH